jgi:hypothetical protein
MERNLMEGSLEFLLRANEVNQGFGNTKSAKPTQKAQTNQGFSLCFLCWFCAFCVPAAAHLTDLTSPA